MGRVPEPPAKYGSAVKELARPDFIRTMRYKDQQLRAPLGMGDVLADPRIVKFARGLVHEAAKYGVPLFPHQFVRDELEQNRLYKHGFSTVQYPDSAHNHGLAVDVIHSVIGWGDVTRAQWAVIGAMGYEVARKQGIKVEWGGDWNFYDPAHWQIAKWRQEVIKP